MATTEFLSDLPPAATENWERLVRESVAGPDSSTRMIWHPEEGLAVRPYYRSEDLAGLPFLNAAPGEFPYLRGTRLTGDWRICEEVDVLDPEEANRTARDAVSAGAEEIAFCGTRIESSADLALVLSGLETIPVQLRGVNAQTVWNVVQRLKERPRTAETAMNLDQLTDLDFAAQVIRAAPAGLRAFTVSAEAFHEHGAGAIEELGFALSAGVDFIAEMRGRGIAVEQLVAALNFSFAIGPELFIQIAKLRAFRVIWARAVGAFGGTSELSRLVIFARTARWNETVYDPHDNVLRGTTEAIAAILGGADSITVAPFDECYRIPDQSSRHLARNTQIILKREALLSRVADPVGGAYLLESITHTIASKAWKLFQDVESAGGFRATKKSGLVDSVLEHRALTHEAAFANRRNVLVGTNRYPDAAEKALERVDEARIASSHRVARLFEAIRLRTERHVKRTGQSPRILLAEIGDPKMRTARSQFAAEFMACGGFGTTKHQFDHAEEIATRDADLIVLCSSDPEYVEIASCLMPVVRARGAVIVIAGNPNDLEQLRALGIFEFIHLRSNAVEVLSAIQRRIGIES